PRRRGAVQGARPRAARRLRHRRPRAGRALHEGSAVSTADPREPHEEPADGQDPASSGRPGGDIDAEFARLTEGLSFDEAPLTVEDVLSDGTADDQEPTMAVVATSVASATALA